MIQTIIGEKINQTQMFLANGDRIPVTQIFVPENIVVQVKTREKDGYSAVQVGIGKKKKPTKAALGHAKKVAMSYAAQRLREIKTTDADTIPDKGAAFKIEEVFKPGDIVSVTGISKGKGFAGVVKRHNFRGGPKTHGQSDRLRAPGSIGQTTTPGRVYRGKKMAGRMGQDTVTVQNLKIVDLDSVNKKIFIAGLVPGTKHSLVTITRMGEDRKFEPLFKAEEPKTEAVEPVEQVDTAAANEAPVEVKTDAQTEPEVQAAEAQEVKADASKDENAQQTDGTSKEKEAKDTKEEKK